MDTFDLRKQAPTLVVWLLLLAMPFWLVAIGGYVELGTRVVVLGLAAMSLNFLLGYTGVLSFGHAAYFGLGAYGAGMIIRYIVPSTGLGIVVGTLVGTRFLLVAAPELLQVLLAGMIIVFLAQDTIRQLDWSWIKRRPAVSSAAKSIPSTELQQINSDVPVQSTTETGDTTS